MQLEIDLSRPSLSLTKTSYWFITVTSTYHSGPSKKGDGFSFSAKFSQNGQKVTFDGGLSGRITFDFANNQLKISPALEFPWQCKPK
jgi:hypothetical protein